MIKLKRRSGILIPREYLSHEFYYKIKDFLVRRYKQYNSEDYVTNIFYIESEKVLNIPRFFPIEEYVKCEIEDISHDGDDIDITHSIVPRDDLQKTAMKYMMDHDWGTIQLMPGVGKTILAIRTIAERRKKSMVIMHRDSLVKQWKDKIHQFTDLADSEVPILSSSTFEDDLQQSIIICTAQTFKSLLKRNRMKFLMALNKANIGIFIGDEVHTSIGAPSFSECSIHVPAKVVFGLSATPTRADGNEDIIRYHCGPVWEMDDQSGTLDANVTMILMDYKVDIPFRHRYLYWEGKFQRSRYLNLIKNSEEFVNINIALLNKILKDDKDIIYVAERIKLLDIMKEKIKGYPVEKFIAGSSNDVLDTQLVLSTPGKIRDGVDIPQKDCLVMTSPISNIEQICGRVTRSHDDKQTPAIIDFVDYGCPPIANTFYKRKKYYHERGWNITFLFVNNGTIIEVDEETAISFIRGE